MKKVSTVGGEAEQEFFATEADDRTGPGRSHRVGTACWMKRADTCWSRS